ncbi:3-hydroxyisobutyrate dehydrogenase [hydrothermal vent metagenome]|uniref:3-hydroxyisobutyrate dehydrogenase n=1 Tax=hydrothermal vent metagenome TaxID=652676 RepID=A0A3B0S7W6_9ZZZZ
MSSSQTIAFIGLGNMGGPMAANLAKAGMNVRAFDLSQDALSLAKTAGCTPVTSVAEAVTDADVVVTMLPAGKHVQAVYDSKDGVFANAGAGTLFCDCSTIDVPTARAVAEQATNKGFAMVDSPVSGGVAAAQAGTLTFMVGGNDDSFARAEPVLQPMAKAVIHAGDAGAGQAAKICNNMLLGISMIGTCEAFVLAEKLGLDPQRFFDIASKASGQNWSLSSYCPVPGPVPTSPANTDYAPGFATAMMLKDLRLAQQAAHGAGAATPLGAEAQALYAMFDNLGGSQVDFSGIIKMLRGDFKR